jgi:DNA-binding NtrC family response regulator
MGTLVLRDVDCLKPVEQVQLLEWLQQNDFALQVVASTSVPLLPRVATGAFLDSLYYRLNVLYLDLAA